MHRRRKSKERHVRKAQKGKGERLTTKHSDSDKSTGEKGKGVVKEDETNVDMTKSNKKKQPFRVVEFSRSETQIMDELELKCVIETWTCMKPKSPMNKKRNEMT